jgi:hypothetical protein
MRSIEYAIPAGLSAPRRICMRCTASPPFRQDARFLRSAFLIEVDKDLSNHHRVFHAGDDPERSTALPAGLKQQDFLKTPQ